MKKIITPLIAALILFTSNASAILMSEIAPQSITDHIIPSARIGVFIGSFDPLHRDHQLLIDNVFTDDLVDFLIVGANDNMTHKPSASPWEARNSFLTTMYKDHPKILIADDKTFLFPIPGNTVKFIRENAPNTKIYAIMGNDVATIPTLEEEISKNILENGGKVDAWLVNNSRPDLNRSSRIPSSIGGQPVIIFNTDGNLSSSAIRKDERLLRNSNLIDPSVYQKIVEQKLYGTGSISCGKII